MLLPIYVAQWEWQARRIDETTVEAEHARPVRTLGLAEQPVRPKSRSLSQMFSLTRLVTALGYMMG